MNSDLGVYMELGNLAFGVKGEMQVEATMSIRVPKQK